jgi:hypothetical protein
MEKRGFLCHDVLLPLSFVYIAFILRGMVESWNVETSSAADHTREENIESDGQVALVPFIGTVMVALFLATPMTYFLLNHNLLTGMPQTTIATTRTTTTTTTTAAAAAAADSTTRRTTTSTTSSGGKPDAAIPDICDIDVAVINNLIYNATIHKIE